MTVTTLRRLPVPASEPPYDDERTGHGTAAPGVPAVQGTLALAFLLPSGVPSAPVPPRPTCGWCRRGRRRTRRPTPSSSGRSPPPPPTLPEARGWAGRFAQAWWRCSPATARSPSWCAGRPPASTTRWPRSSPARASARPDAARGVVRSVHVSEPADGVAEVCALVRRGARSTAVALRLEGLDGRWQCTALELG